eukprot:gnl/MRDRNA2_/MRDRNA2_82741_c0_seq1.p1 gnl/MRDRNA2_/MRDRNA2_82741_c0~~gnl/MRDRNA2_/MRDRNA2_82741_c0_seq1.p1  ORF type:complete len:1485 (+),score=246.79 gnl/MRDRNA2_/MRDRNA2_82741_c0_seq1:274-4455(+)
MVLCSCKDDVVTYTQGLRKALRDVHLGNQFEHPLEVAGVFSGMCHGMGEAKLNEGIGCQVDPTGARILVVCDKYELGYDNPSLSMLFVDKRFRSPGHAVQVLSRPNRAAPGKKGAFVWDVSGSNKLEEIRQYFSMYCSEKVTFMPEAEHMLQQLDEALRQVEHGIVPPALHGDIIKGEVDAEDTAPNMPKRHRIIGKQPPTPSDLELRESIDAALIQSTSSQYKATSALTPRPPERSTAPRTKKQLQLVRDTESKPPERSAGPRTPGRQPELTGHIHDQSSASGSRKELRSSVSTPLRKNQLRRVDEVGRTPPPPDCSSVPRRLGQCAGSSKRRVSTVSREDVTRSKPPSQNSSVPDAESSVYAIPSPLSSRASTSISKKASAESFVGAALAQSSSPASSSNEGCPSSILSERGTQPLNTPQPFLGLGGLLSRCYEALAVQNAGRELSSLSESYVQLCQKLHLVRPSIPQVQSGSCDAQRGCRAPMTPMLKVKPQSENLSGVTPLFDEGFQKNFELPVVGRVRLSGPHSVIRKLLDWEGVDETTMTGKMAAEIGWEALDEYSMNGEVAPLFVRGWPIEDGSFPPEAIFLVDWGQESVVRASFPKAVLLVHDPGSKGLQGRVVQEFCRARRLPLAWLMDSTVNPCALSTAKLLEWQVRCLENDVDLAGARANSVDESGLGLVCPLLLRPPRLERKGVSYSQVMLQGEQVAFNLKCYLNGLSGMAMNLPDMECHAENEATSADLCDWRFYMSNIHNLEKQDRQILATVIAYACSHKEHSLRKLAGLPRDLLRLANDLSQGRLPFGCVQKTFDRAPEWDRPCALASDGCHSIFVAERRSGVIYKGDVGLSSWVPVAGTAGTDPSADSPCEGSARKIPLRMIWDIAAEEDTLYIVDWVTHSKSCGVPVLGRIDDRDWDDGPMGRLVKVQDGWASVLLKLRTPTSVVMVREMNISRLFVSSCHFIRRVHPITGSSEIVAGRSLQGRGGSSSVGGCGEDCNDAKESALDVPRGLCLVPAGVCGEQAVLLFSDCRNNRVRCLLPRRNGSLLEGPLEVKTLCQFEQQTFPSTLVLQGGRLLIMGWCCIFVAEFNLVGELSYRRVVTVENPCWYVSALAFHDHLLCLDFFGPAVIELPRDVALLPMQKDTALHKLWCGTPSNARQDEDGDEIDEGSQYQAVGYRCCRAAVPIPLGNWDWKGCGCPIGTKAKDHEIAHMNKLLSRDFATVGWWGFMDLARVIHCKRLLWLSHECMWGNSAPMRNAIRSIQTLHKLPEDTWVVLTIQSGVKAAAQLASLQDRYQHLSRTDLRIDFCQGFRVKRWWVLDKPWNDEKVQSLVDKSVSQLFGMKTLNLTVHHEALAKLARKIQVAAGRKRINDRSGREELTSKRPRRTEHLFLFFWG